jgi:hypothetical protein
VLAFDLAEKYRTITIVMADGSIGQMMEPAELPPMRPIKTEKPDWAVTGADPRSRPAFPFLDLYQSGRGRGLQLPVDADLESHPGKRDSLPRILPGRC